MTEQNSSHVRIWQSARCCGRTRQRWRLEGKDFPTDGDVCFECGQLLHWGNEIRRVAAIRKHGSDFDLGLDLLHRRLAGRTATEEEIAAWAGWTRGHINGIIKKALRRLRKKEWFMQALKEHGGIGMEEMEAL